MRLPCEHPVHRMEHRGLTFSWPFPNHVSDLEGLIAIPKVFSQGQHFGHAAVKVSKLKWRIKINKQPYAIDLGSEGGDCAL